MSDESSAAGAKGHTEARQFSQLAGRRGPVAENMAAERALLGQLLTFCAFLGGFSLAAVIALFELVRPEAEPLFDATLSEPVVTFAQILLALTSISALSGAFFALLGFINHNHMLQLLTKVRHVRVDELDEHTQATVRVMTNKVANTVIFRQMARFLAVVAMAAALVGVISVSYLVWNWMALVLFILAGLLLVSPIIAAQALKMRLRQVPLEHWLPHAYEEPHEDEQAASPSATEASHGNKDA